MLEPDGHLRDPLLAARELEKNANRGDRWCRFEAAPASWDYIGKRNRATQPGPGERFSRPKDPPCASAICRLKTNPIPDPPGLVVKKGTNRFALFGSPGPSSVTTNSNHA